ncbi:MAG: hypothetical protein R8K46_02805 [Mariprofundaceae bacterium]
MADKEPDKSAAKAGVPAAKKETVGKETPKKAKKEKKRGPWMLMLAIAATLAAIWFFTPSEIRQDVAGLFSPTQSQREVVAPKAVAPAAPMPRKVVAPAPPPPPPPPSVSSQEVEALRDSIGALNDSLRELRDETANLRQVMGERQLPDIRARLNWVANPASSLDQIYFAWSDIAVAAGLDEEQRSQAEEMRDLSARHWQARRAWVSALEAIAKSLMRGADEEAGEAGEASLQASFEQWVRDNFHLSRSDVGDRMIAAELEYQVEQAIKAVKNAQWPEAEPWQQLLRVIRESGEPATGLPEDFTEISSDIDALRAQARAWLEQL